MSNIVKALLIINVWSKEAQMASIAKRRKRQLAPELDRARQLLKEAKRHRKVAKDSSGGIAQKSAFGREAKSHNESEAKRKHSQAKELVREYRSIIKDRAR